MNILIFRPQAKCHSSVKAFDEAGLNAVCCGLIDTELDAQALIELPEKINNLAANSLIIVTSTVAAEQCVAHPLQWPATTSFFAVGQSTACILSEAGLPTVVPQEARSEGLLALSALQNVKNKHIVIIKGFGGRELLAETLIARGAIVEEWALYKRISLAQPHCTSQWQAEQIQCIIATSGEVIEAAFNHYAAAWLQTKLWIVVSERTATIAEQHGVKQLLISRSASDQALIVSAKHALSSM